MDIGCYSGPGHASFAVHAASGSAARQRSRHRSRLRIQRRRTRGASPRTIADDSNAFRAHRPDPEPAPGSAGGVDSPSRPDQAGYEPKSPGEIGRQMTRTGLGRVAVLAAAVALVVPALADAGNEVTKWNEIAVNTVNAQAPITSGPPAGAVFVAMVQGAVYGAVNAVDRHGKPYLINRSFPKASAEAAAATAAYKVLSALFPSGALDTAYVASLQGIAAGKSKDQGIEVGQMAADAMLAEGHDGRTVIGCTFGSGAAGEWMPLAGPAGPLCDPTPWVAEAKPFVLKTPSQFRTAGPYALTSAQWAADFNEVKSLGAVDSTTRTADQTHAAAFWQTNPAANYNALARRFVDQFSPDTSDSARLFAMLDLSAADAIINVWNDKYHYRFWRPITAIRFADDGNPATQADPTWTPLFNPALP